MSSQQKDLASVQMLVLDQQDRRHILIYIQLNSRAGQKDVTICVPAKGPLPMGSFCGADGYGLTHPNTISAAVLQCCIASSQETTNHFKFDAMVLAPNMDLLMSCKDAERVAQTIVPDVSQETPPATITEVASGVSQETPPTAEAVPDVLQETPPATITEVASGVSQETPPSATMEAASGAMQETTFIEESTQSIYTT